MSREQIKFTFQIGLPMDTPEDVLFHFKKDIASAASHVSGGCTMSQKTGYWKEGGDERHKYFGGVMIEEIAVELEVTCEMHKAEDCYAYIKDMIAAHANAYGLKTDWVHVTETKMTGRHFSIEDHLGGYNNA